MVPRTFTELLNAVNTLVKVHGTPYLNMMPKYDAYIERRNAYNYSALKKGSRMGDTIS